MDPLDNLKPISLSLILSILKEETLNPDASSMLTKEDKERILFNLTDKDKREELLNLRKKLNKKKSWESLITLIKKASI